VQQDAELQNIIAGGTYN